MYKVSADLKNIQHMCCEVHALLIYNLFRQTLSS